MADQAKEINDLAGKDYKVLLGEKEIIVRPLVIGDYLKLYSDFINLFSEVLEKYPDLDLENLDNLKPTDLLKFAPILPNIMGLIDKVLKVEKGTIENNATIEQLTFLITLILKVNRIKEIRENLSIAKSIWKAEQKKEPVNPAMRKK